MRYQPAHAAPRGSVPLMFRVPKSVRMGVSVAVAGIFGLVPTVMIASPAMAVDPTTITVSSPAAVVEGVGISFVVTLTGVGGPVTFTSSAAGTPATAGSDFTLPGVTALSVGANTVVVATSDDTLYEGGAGTFESFNLIATSGAASGSGVGMISDNDVAPTYTLTASPVTVAENGALSSIVTATLHEASGVAVGVTFSSQDVTAVAGADYTAVAATATIAPTATTATTTVTVLADGVKDLSNDEYFLVKSVATNVTGTDASAQVHITDAQTVPTLTLTATNNVAALEGGAAIVYTVTPTPRSELPITFRWDAVAASPVNPAHGLATPGTDFLPYPTADARIVTIPAMAASVPISLTPVLDGVNEISPEDFAIAISAPTNATLGATTTVNGSIADAIADSAPVVTITPTTVTEGNLGATTKTFTATLSKLSGRTITAQWTTTDGTAVVVKDYKYASGTLVFPVGTTVQTFTVDIMGDTVDEGTGETFNIVVTSLDSTLTGTSTGVITITDDDDPPTFAVGDISMKEGDAASALLVPIRLTGSSSMPIVFTVANTVLTGDALSSSGTAVGQNDYNIALGTVTVPAEAVAGYAVLLINGDMVFEKDESTHFTTSYTSGGAVTGVAKVSKLTLENDDLAPNLEINNVTGEEGDTVAVTGTVTGISDDYTLFNVLFAGGASHGSVAASSFDFTNPGAKLVPVTAGTLPGTIVDVADVVLIADAAAEPAETIIATGFGTENVGTVTEGIITIAANGMGDPTDPTDPTDPDVPAPSIVLPATIVGAGSVNISGTATTVGSVVELWGADIHTTTFEKIDEQTSVADGDYSFDKDIELGWRFAVRANGQYSTLKYVRIIQLPLFAVSSGVRGTITMVVQGNPKGVAQNVIVQRYSAGKWYTAAKGMTATDSRWSAVLKPIPSNSTWTFRAYIIGDGGDGTIGGYSVSKTVTVK